MILLDGRLLTADAMTDRVRSLVCGSAPWPEAVIRTTLAAIAGVRSVSPGPDDDGGSAQYLIAADPRPSLAAEVVAALVGAGIAVSEILEMPPDLERVFLELTQRSVMAAA